MTRNRITMSLLTCLVLSAYALGNLGVAGNGRHFGNQWNGNLPGNGFGNNGVYASANSQGGNAHATATASGNGLASANAVANANGFSNRFSNDFSNDFGYHGNSNIGDNGINLGPRFVDVDESGTFDNARGVFSSSSASMGPNGQGSYRVRSGKIP